MTAYLSDHVSCSGHHILSDLYETRGGPRTVQHFLATLAGADPWEGSNMVNVHAPSGSIKLTDPQRHTLSKKLLQSTSLRDASTSVGQDKLMTAGDFNTQEIKHSVIRNTLVCAGICNLNSKLECTDAYRRR